MNTDVDQSNVPAPTDDMPVVVPGVSIVGYVENQPHTAEYGSYGTIVFAGTEDKIQLWGYDSRRARGVITCNGTGPVYVGTEAQCAAVKAGNPTGAGYLLPTGQQVIILNRQPVWIIPDQTHPATVSILLERYQE